MSVLRRRRRRPFRRRGSRRPSGGGPHEALTEVTATPSSLEKDFQTRVSYEDVQAAEADDGDYLEKVPLEQRCADVIEDQGEEKSCDNGCN